jgi:hypothetical protein
VRERLAVALVVLGPVAIMPGALNRFVFIKVAVVAAGVAVALTCPRRGRLPYVAVVGLIAAGLLLAVDGLLGSAPLPQLLGRGPRYEGLPVLAAYVGAAMAGARLLGPDRPGDTLRWFGRCLAVASLLVGLLAVLEAAGLRPLSSSVARPGSLLGNASDEGAYAVLAAGPLAALGLALRDRWMQLGAASATLVVVLSASRGALLGLLATAVVLSIFLRGRQTRIVLVVAGALAVVLVLALPQVRHRALGESSFAGHTTHGRVLLWDEAVAVIARHSVTGVGPSGFEDAVVARHSLRWQTDVGPTDPPDSPHNWVLQAAAAGGVPLAVLALLAVGYVARRGYAAARAQERSSSPPLAVGAGAGLAGYIVALLVHFTAPSTALPAALLAGVLVAEGVAAARTEPRALRVAGPVVAGALALFMLLAATAEIPLKSAVIDVTHGDLRGAQHAFNAAHALRPWDVEIPLAAGHAFAAGSLAGQRDAAAYGETWLRDAVRRVPTSEQAREDLAVVSAAQGDFATALRLLDQALGRDPHNPELLLRRGVVHAQLTQYAAAEHDFLDAASVAVRSPEPWQDLATLYRLEHRDVDADRAREEAQRRR